MKSLYLLYISLSLIFLTSPTTSKYCHIYLGEEKCFDEIPYEAMHECQMAQAECDDCLKWESIDYCVSTFKDSGCGKVRGHVCQGQGYFPESGLRGDCKSWQLLCDNEQNSTSCRMHDAYCNESDLPPMDGHFPEGSDEWEGCWKDRENCRNGNTQACDYVQNKCDGRRF